eukprot:SAG31_NODE_10283_length_1160_cov_28.335533_1_plen_255_part_00
MLQRGSRRERRSGAGSGATNGVEGVRTAAHIGDSARHPSAQVPIEGRGGVEHWVGAKDHRSSGSGSGISKQTIARHAGQAQKRRRQRDKLGISFPNNLEIWWGMFPGRQGWDKAGTGGGGLPPRGSRERRSGAGSGATNGVAEGCVLKRISVTALVSHPLRSRLKVEASENTGWGRRIIAAAAAAAASANKPSHGTQVRPKSWMFLDRKTSEGGQKDCYWQRRGEWFLCVGTGMVCFAARRSCWFLGDRLGKAR